MELNFRRYFFFKSGVTAAAVQDRSVILAVHGGTTNPTGASGRASWPTSRSALPVGGEPAVWFQPGRRFLVAAILLLAFAAAAQTTNGQSPAEIQGRQLAREILEEAPATNLTQTGILRIRNSEGITNIPITFTTAAGQGYWRVTYATTPANDPDASESLIILHQAGQPNEYFIHRGMAAGTTATTNSLSHSQIMTPFAGSDFWIADLGLEFFHWPDQKITGHETRRTRDCTVLESDNPDPSAVGYSRVVSWIDNETLGIIHAEAYDANGKLFKVFDPKSLKKVNGQWELQDIEIRNVQTHSRTWIRFDLSGKS